MENLERRAKVFSGNVVFLRLHLRVQGSFSWQCCQFKAGNSHPKKLKCFSLMRQVYLYACGDSFVLGNIASCVLGRMDRKKRSPLTSDGRPIFISRNMSIRNPPIH